MFLRKCILEKTFKRMLTIHSVKYQIHVVECGCFLEFSQTNAEVGDISVPLGLVNDDHLSSSTHRGSNGEAPQPNRKNLLLILKHCKICKCCPRSQY